MRKNLRPLIGVVLVIALNSTPLWTGVAVASAPGPAVPDTAAVEMAAFIIFEGDTLWLAAPLEVVGSRIPAALPGVVRKVDVLTYDDITHVPGRSAADLLQTVPGVKMNQRQNYGIQGDLTIRGSTFDQVQVLINGYDAGDPQTGHHLMDLPMAQQDISRLEVLPGHGSALYGAGAFGGTVNVVSRRPAGRNGGELALMGGGNGTWSARGSAELGNGGATAARISAERFRTDGHDVIEPDGTEVWGDNDAVSGAGTGRITHQADEGEWDGFVGYSDREFGALDYYAPFPSVERTRVLFASGLYRRTVSENLTLEPRLFYRQHRDEFALFRSNPDAYTNDHKTRKMGAELRGITVLNESYALALSLEGVYEDIDSQGLRGGVWGEALGYHTRRRASAAVEVDRTRGDLIWQLGGRVDFRDIYEPEYSGTGAVAYALTSVMTARASVGNVFRVPTFTDLYYEDPANVGNADLQPEYGWTWDGTLTLQDGPWNLQAGYFERYGEDLIEWARAVGDPVWQVLNVGSGTTRGVETGAGWRHPRGHRIDLGWTWLEQENELPDGFEGKYALLVPRQVLTARGELVMPADFRLGVGGRYIEHNDGPEYFRIVFVLDARLDWRNNSGVFAGVQGTNLLDRLYEDVPGVQMPGILFTATLGKEF